MIIYVVFNKKKSFFYTNNIHASYNSSMCVRISASTNTHIYIHTLYKYNSLFVFKKKKNNFNYIYCK